MTRKSELMLYVLFGIPVVALAFFLLLMSPLGWFLIAFLGITVLGVRSALDDDEDVGNGLDRVNCPVADVTAATTPSSRNAYHGSGQRLPVDRIHVSTVVCLPPEEVYDFLVDFPRYAQYSKYLTGVTADGNGTPGTRYHLRFSWWKLSYTAHTEVTDADPPTRLDWRVVDDLDARGHWRVEPLESVPDGLPADADTACRVHFDVEFDPDSVGGGTLDLPRFVSLDWVVRKVKPILVEEAERVVERIVADIEGRHREVELVVHAVPGGV